MRCSNLATIYPKPRSFRQFARTARNVVLARTEEAYAPVAEEKVEVALPLHTRTDFPISWQHTVLDIKGMESGKVDMAA